METPLNPTIVTSRRGLMRSALALGLCSSLAELMLSDEALAAPNGSSLWMDQRMQDHLQRVLALSDPEWQALSPRIDAVLKFVRLRDQFSRTKPPKPPRDDRPPRDLATGGDIVSLNLDSSLSTEPGSPAADMRDYYLNLIALASDKLSRAGELKDMLTRFRSARTKVADQLTKAREDLRSLVTTKQEVVLVVMGILD